MEGHVPGVAGEWWPEDHNAEDWGLEPAGRRDSEVQILSGGLGKDTAQKPVRHKGESEGRNRDAGQEK